MAKKNTILSFAKNILSQKETKTLKGGRSYEPNVTGSNGFVNWDDVDIRRPNIVASNHGATKFTSSSLG